MAVENLVSGSCTTLDTLPIQMLSAGEGASGVLNQVDDWIAATSSGMTQTGSTYRLCRFPVYAKIKSVVIDLGVLDTGAAGAVFDVNVAFSDSLYDGTQTAFTPNNGLTETTALCIPTTAKTGACTSISSYTAPNKLFGTLTVGNNVAKYNTELLWNGSLSGWWAAGSDTPLWDFFGFSNSQGYPADPSGYFDLLLYLSTQATTPAAANIRARVSYVVSG
jgi:hypothetical protein